MPEVHASPRAAGARFSRGARRLVGHMDPYGVFDCFCNSDSQPSGLSRGKEHGLWLGLSISLASGTGLGLRGCPKTLE